MTQFVQAIFEHGVFRPLEPVKLAEHERVSLVVSALPIDAKNGAAANDAAALNRQREALAALRAEMDSLPPCTPVDGLGGADHDAILYGGQQ